MSQKIMKIVVELNLRAVTCPGVHLPEKDDVYLSVCLMNQYRQSECLPAVFPLLFREKMRFEKVYWHATDPAALAQILECELAKVELIQLTPPGGESLAMFVEDVRSFLFPEPKLVPPAGGVDRAVLMTKGPAFMGICPRLEFNTRTIISECSPSPDPYSEPIPVRVLTQKRMRRKHERSARCSTARLNHSVPFPRGRQRSRERTRRSSGPARARSLSPYTAALLGRSSNDNSNTHGQHAASTHTLQNTWSDSWRGGDGQSSLNTNGASRARSPSPPPRSPRKPGMQSMGTMRRSRSSGWALEDSCPSPTDHLLDDSSDEDLDQSGPNPAALWRSYREKSHPNGSLLCSENVWEDVQRRLRSLLTSPQAIGRLANGATDSEVDEVFSRRTKSNHKGGT
ncbi:spermatogenesis associated 6-like protein isoform X2 [Engraulis encrasicolus]|uniref:spermatogenesis associated 6-like protein isoform X2 n=1 Tax=Engraulis encrasicolus TaxID=184585 RepID=UPI002FD72178